MPFSESQTELSLQRQALQDGDNAGTKKARTLLRRIFDPIDCNCFVKYTYYMTYIFAIKCGTTLTELNAQTNIKQSNLIKLYSPILVVAVLLNFPQMQKIAIK